MAVKKKEQSAKGVPEWVVTFGDMMSLLLCFFIFLQMFSELKRDHEYQRVITAVQEAFGFSGGIGVLPVDDLPLTSVIETMEAMARKKDGEQSRVSHNDEAGVHGPNLRVTKVQEGIVFTLGGPATFAPESAELQPAAKREIEQLAVMLAGRSNKIRIIGHAAKKYLSPGSPWQDLDELSFARAQGVRALLVELGLDDEVFQIVAAGTREPANPRAMDEMSAAENRRVQIILTENLVEDFNRDAHQSDPALARGG